MCVFHLKVTSLLLKMAEGVEGARLEEGRWVVGTS